MLPDAIMKVLRAGGNVLLPIDTAGRALELILHLDQVCSLLGIFSLGT
jgi:cleavage and polyadenylation specificity factor subunit 2